MTGYMDAVCNIVLLFFTFSVLGWCMEVTLKYIQFHRFINRGFFIGPYCPIYGTGVVLVTLTVGSLARFERSYGMTFISSFFVCGAVEYIASYYMEKKYHARWWDYSQKPMNLNGRVWIGNLILFGIGGTAIVKIFDPFFFSLYDDMLPLAKYVLVCVLLAVFITDDIVSHLIMKVVKVSVENSEADDTEEVSKEVKMLLHNKSILHQRIADAYPDVIYKTERITKKLNAVEAETKRLREEARQKKEKITERISAEKETLEATLETSGVVKNSIIEKQEELITLLEQSSTDTEKIAALKDEIQKKKQQLSITARLKTKKQESV